MEFDKKVLYISRYASCKRLEDYHEIARRIPKIRFLHAGSGSKSFVADLEELNNLTFLGYVSEKDKNLLLKYTDIYVTTSDYEGFNVPILEALAKDKLIIARKLKVYRELFEDYPVYCETVDDFVKSIKNSALHEIERKEKSYLREYLLRKYTWEKSAERLHIVLEEDL